ncbi:NFATC2-interacting protein [Nematolebias whitei]|uniref:NFATC2-interacting protein n=1 Tax=Nematolebias whitei TaxID=451745 RepID=UPI001896F714|nr:NFATC2-interacting protein [Nematolebias whitei]
MAEAVSDGDVQIVKPPFKRRRVLDPSAVVPVPVYSNQVSSSLQLKPTAALFSEKETADDGADDGLWAAFSTGVPLLPDITLSDSEDEAELDELVKPVEEPRCPSPPPESPVQKQSRKVTQKINDINKRLRAVSAVLSPEPQTIRSRSNRTPSSPPPGLELEDLDDDVIMSPTLLHTSDLVREIPLKIRCRADVHKIPVLSTTRLNCVVKKLSVILNVPPPRLLLLRDDVELSVDSTIGELGLGIADIIECVAMAAEESSSITVKLQSKDRDSCQEFSIHREAPLGSVFSQYLTNISAGARRKVRFLFDGAIVTDSQTAAQLDMEDGDIIEVWT